MFRSFSFYSIFMLIINYHYCLSQLVGYSNNVDEPAFVPRVVKGQLAKLGDVPYQLAFKSIKNRATQTYRTFCGGSIIGVKKVLSAAHCFKDDISWFSRCSVDAGKVSRKKIARTFAVAGNLLNTAKYVKQDSLENGQWRRLLSIYIPHNYKFPKNDIAVGFTREPFLFNTNVGLIPFAISRSEYTGECLVSGYGKTSSTTSSTVLQKAHLQVLSSSWCSRLHRRNMQAFICTSDKVSSVLQGDSGGPLICKDPLSHKDVLAGVVSGSREGSGTFFTRVSSFSKFVQRGRGCGVRSNIIVIVVLMCLLRCNIAVLILFDSSTSELEFFDKVIQKHSEAHKRKLHLHKLVNL